MSWQAGVGIGLGILGLLGTIFTFGQSIAAAGGMLAAISSASAAELVVGGLGGPRSDLDALNDEIYFFKDTYRIREGDGTMFFPKKQHASPRLNILAHGALDADGRGRIGVNGQRGYRPVN